MKTVKHPYRLLALAIIERASKDDAYEFMTSEWLSTLTISMEDVPEDVTDAIVENRGLTEEDIIKDYFFRYGLAAVNDEFGREGVDYIRKHFNGNLYQDNRIEASIRKMAKTMSLSKIARAMKVNMPKLASYCKTRGIECQKERNT